MTSKSKTPADASGTEQFDWNLIQSFVAVMEAGSLTGAAKALEKRGNQPPGMHVRFRRPSNYGRALMEKQKIKHYYGLGERQLRRYFEKATRQKGNTGENLLLICLLSYKLLLSSYFVQLLQSLEQSYM